MFRICQDLLHSGTDFLRLRYFAGRPDQVHNCTIMNISTTSINIKCSEGFNGGLTQSFSLEVRESQTQVSRGFLG